MAIHDKDPGPIAKRLQRLGYAAILRNVVWNTMQVKVKGDDQRVYNNTVFDSENIDFSILDRPSFGGINKKTITRNNAAGRIAGEFKKPQVPIPGTSSHNWTGDIRSQLRDPDNLDFRPKAGAALIDVAMPVPGVTDQHLGKAPDIGAYEFGAKRYWIPGRKTEQASTPIPPHKAQNVKQDADLIWLGAYRALSHDIYFGPDADAVSKAGRKSKEFKGNQTNNIFSPGRLDKGKIYHWRIDAVTPTKTIKGKVWNFSL